MFLNCYCFAIYARNDKENVRDSIDGIFFTHLCHIEIIVTLSKKRGWKQSGRNKLGLCNNWASRRGHMIADISAFKSTFKRNTRTSVAIDPIAVVLHAFLMWTKRGFWCLIQKIISYSSCAIRMHELALDGQWNWFRSFSLVMIQLNNCFHYTVWPIQTSISNTFLRCMRA